MVQKDNIHIARPNRHMPVKDNKFYLGAGSEKNRFRSFIDVLFSSADVASGPLVFRSLK